VACHYVGNEKTVNQASGEIIRMVNFIKSAIFCFPLIFLGTHSYATETIYDGSQYVNSIGASCGIKVEKDGGSSYVRVNCSNGSWGNCTGNDLEGSYFCETSKSRDNPYGVENAINWVLNNL